MTGLRIRERMVGDIALPEAARASAASRNIECLA
jgi:hypothetical protein